MITTAGLYRLLLIENDQILHRFRVCKKHSINFQHPSLLTNQTSILFLFLPLQHNNFNINSMFSRFSTVVLSTFFVFTAISNLYAQNSYISYTKSSGKLANAFDKVEDSLKKQFEDKKLAWPPQQIYVRSFKFDRVLEVWVKDDLKSVFKLFKSYRVCMQSGSMGPKRMEGDYQVPEGFYYINEFNPNSNYHLALGLNYPNASR